MISIFDNWSEKEKKLLETYKKEEYDNVSIILNDDGFLPDDVISPFRYYVQKNDGYHLNGAPLFSNFLKIPELWEIAMGFDKAEIWDEGIKKAEIEYTTPNEFHNVKNVKWLSPDGVVYKIDGYDQYGNLYYEEFFDNESKVDLRIFYTKDRRPVLIYQPQFDAYTLMKEGEVEKIWNSSEEFLEYFINYEFAQEDTIISNNISLAKVLDKVNINKKIIIIQNELLDVEPLSNIKNKEKFCLMFMSEAMLQKWKTKLEILSKRFYYRENSFPNSNSGNEVFILTNSDQIEKLEVLVRELPKLHFHIAAKTAMSEKLMDMDKWSNVSLYQGISEAKRIELLNTCTYYLDINYYKQICDAVYEAYRHNLLIVGFDVTLHEPAYTLAECTFRVDGSEQMIRFLMKTFDDKEFLRKMLKKQNKLPSV